MGFYSLTLVMQVGLLKHQHKTLTSKAKYKLLISGVGGGKTWCGVHWVLNMSKAFPNSLGFIGANTHSQLRNSTLSAVFNELMRLEIQFHYNQSSGILEILGKKWLCKSMENFDVLRGIEVGEVWLDEAAYMKEEAFNVISGRLRDNKGALEVLITTTPKGFNWVYHNFHPEGDSLLNNSLLIKATSKDNKFLPDGYVESLKDQYDSKLIEQELSGEFVNISSGVIYYGFERERNVARAVNYDSRLPVWVGMDFNPNRMACVVGQIKDGILHIIDEIFDTSVGANTERLAKEVISRYGYNVTIIPDSTGKKATSNASRSDHQILKDLGLKIKTAHNPFRLDRYAAVNSALEKGLVLIGEQNKHIIKDLEVVSYVEGSDKVDTSDPNTGHMADAFGYLLYRTVNPLKNKTNKVSSQLR